MKRLLLFRNLVMTFQHMQKNSNLFVYKFVVSCQILYQVVPYKAEAWHACSQEQYFSKHRFQISANVPLESPKTKTLADGLIERTSSMLDDIEAKTVHKDKESDQQRKKKFVSHRGRISKEFDSRKDSQSKKFKRRPRTFKNPSFKDLCDSKLSGLHAFDNLAIIH